MSKDVILVDPVLDHFKYYLEYLKKRDLVLTMVVDTHTHADHISSASALRDITGCDYIMHKMAPAGCVTKRISEGHHLRIGEVQAKVMETPGHSKDSISLIFDDRILTGDALFLNDAGAGRDDLPGGGCH